MDYDRLNLGLFFWKTYFVNISKLVLRKAGFSTKRFVFVFKGTRLMFTRNLWTEFELYTGSIGNMRDIVYQEGANPPTLPFAIIVQFHEYYKGSSLIPFAPR